MLTVDLILLIASGLCFLVATKKQEVLKVNLIALGLLLYIVYLIYPLV